MRLVKDPIESKLGMWANFHAGVWGEGFEPGCNHYLDFIFPAQQAVETRETSAQAITVQVLTASLENTMASRF